MVQVQGVTEGRQNTVDLSPDSTTLVVSLSSVMPLSQSQPYEFSVTADKCKGRREHGGWRERGRREERQ